MGAFECLEMRALLSANPMLDITLGPQTGFFDQPYVDIELSDPSTGVGLGPYGAGFDIYPYNHLLLDTGANSALIVSDAAADLAANGYQTEGLYRELGVAGYTEFEVSAPYQLDFRGTDNVAHTLPQTADQVRVLSSPDVILGLPASWGGIPGIIGMPAMVNRVTTLEWGHWANATDLFDLMPMEVTFSEPGAAVPPGQGHRYSVPVDDRIAFDPADGLPPGDPNGPLPVWAPVPFMTAIAENNGVTQEGNFLLDTGAQMSLISPQMAFSLGLDEDGDGNFDNEKLFDLPISGVGGTVNAPVLSVDKLRLPTEQGVDLVWQGADPSNPEDLGLQFIVSDIGEGSGIDGVFGVDLLTAGLDMNFDPVTFDISFDGVPYFDQVHFDFNDMMGGSGTLYFDVNPALDVDAAPAVASILRADPNPTTGGIVDFTVNFSKDVTGVDAGDFQLVTDGLVGASIASAGGSGTTYTVSVNTGDGVGTLRLDLIDDDSITDGGGVPLGGTGAGNGDFTAGQAYTVVSGLPSQVPGQPDLAAGFDTGQSNSDDLTNRDNSTAATTLRFRVPGTFAGATVTIYADGTAIGSAVSSGGTAVVNTDGSVDLADGLHQITARQTEPGQEESADSAALSVTIDTGAPAVTVTTLVTTDTSPELTGGVNDASARVEVTLGTVAYAAANQAPAGWSVAAGTVGPLGPGTYDVQVAATDPAGNVGTDSTSDELTVLPDNAPPELNAIGDQTLQGTLPVSIPLSATDPDQGDVLVFSAQGQSLAYQLDQQLGLYSNGNLWENWGGQGDKWLLGSGQAWYFILPDGGLYLWAGTGMDGTLVDTPGPYYHQNIAALYDAEPSPPAQVSVETATGDPVLVIDPDDGFLGTFLVTATVSDGRDEDRETFRVTVEPPPPVNHPPVADDDHYRMTQDGTLEVPGPGVLEGDTDIDADPLEAVLADDVAGGLLALNADGSFTYEPPAGYTGTATFTYRAYDGELYSDPATVTIDVNPAAEGPALRTGVVHGVSNTGWTEVVLDHTYTSMVVVATANYDAGSVPLVTRVQNVQPDRFEVRVDRTDGSAQPVAAVDVHYLVVEEGVYTEAENGVTMEAAKFTSTVTDHAGSWVAEGRTFANQYAQPVVVGQVMSYNDPRWSVFWSRSDSARGNAPDGTLRVGKHVGEDPARDRADETIGYVVIDAGSGVLDGISYSAGVGADTVYGTANAPPYTYVPGAPAGASTAVVSQAGMDGGNGGWAVLYGANPVSSGTLNLAIDEDQAKDLERSHTSEQVAYLVLGSPPVNHAPQAFDDAYTVTGDTTLAVAAPGVLANDADPDGDALAAVLAGDVAQGTLDLHPDGSFAYTPEAGFVGDVSFTYRASDGQEDSQAATVTITVEPVAEGPYLTTGVVHNVSNTGWTEVVLDHTYTSMVVVATANYDAAGVSLVTRVQNAENDRFEIRVDRADGQAGSVAGVDVHYLVVEEGVYTEAQDGVTMEAAKFTSTVTDHAGSWVAESRTFANQYTQPVVVGQVMSYNDPRWSVFWSRSNSAKGNAPDGTLRVGKHVGEDPATDRADETIGYVVIETGTGTIDGIGYSAALGTDTIYGMSNAPPYTYAPQGLASATAAVASQAGMDGGNGGWAVLYGDGAVGADTLKLAIEEDQARDAERKHTSEQVAYLVFDASSANASGATGFNAVLGAFDMRPLQTVAAGMASGRGDAIGALAALARHGGDSPRASAASAWLRQFEAIDRVMADLAGGTAGRHASEPLGHDPDTRGVDEALLQVLALGIHA